MQTLGEHMGHNLDEGDMRIVRRIQELQAAKMRAAQTGGASEQELGPSEIEQQLGQQAQQLRKSTASAQAKQAQAAQAQQTSPQPPAAPSSPVGTSKPYPAEGGAPAAPSVEDTQPQIPGLQSPGAEAGEIEQ